MFAWATSRRISAESIGPVTLRLPSNGLKNISPNMRLPHGNGGVSRQVVSLVQMDGHVTPSGDVLERRCGIG
jgi:hypothetical protein